MGRRVSLHADAVRQAVDGAILPMPPEARGGAYGRYGYCLGGPGRRDTPALPRRRGLGSSRILLREPVCRNVEATRAQRESLKGNTDELRAILAAGSWREGGAAVQGVGPLYRSG